MKEATAEELLRRKVGERVHALRTASGLTQTQLGARSNKEQGTISRIESGDYRALTVAVLLDLAHGLGCQPGDLLDWPLGIMDIVGRQKRQEVAA